jgi:hypothetical protein
MILKCKHRLRIYVSIIPWIVGLFVIEFVRFLILKFKICVIYTQKSAICLVSKGDTIRYERLFNLTNLD